MGAVLEREHRAELRKKWILFLARGKRNKKGERRTIEQFAQAIGVNPNTLYEWRREPGFMQELLEETIAEHAGDLPDMISAHSSQAKGAEAFYLDSKGNRKKLSPDVQSFRELMKLWGLTVDRTQVEGSITHKWSEAPDDELDRAIKAREDRIAGNA